MKFTNITLAGLIAAAGIRSTSEAPSYGRIAGQVRTRSRTAGRPSPAGSKLWRQARAGRMGMSTIR